VSSYKDEVGLRQRCDPERPLPPVRFRNVDPPDPGAKGWVGSDIDVARTAPAGAAERATPHCKASPSQGATTAIALTRRIDLPSLWSARRSRRSAFTSPLHRLRIDAPYLPAVTRVEWAKKLLRRNGPGDRDRACAMLEQALATAREYGFGGVERQAMRLLGQPP
jgi:hypothetical protein